MCLYAILMAFPAPQEFVSIKDAKYAATKLDVLPFTQTVHPEAQVQLTSPKRTEEIWTCARNASQLELSLSVRLMQPAQLGLC